MQLRSETHARAPETALDAFFVEATVSANLAVSSQKGLPPNTIHSSIQLSKWHRRRLLGVVFHMEDVKNILLTSELTPTRYQMDT